IRQLAALLQAGLPLAEGLELLAQQQPNAQWQALLQTLAEDLADDFATVARMPEGALHATAAQRQRDNSLPLQSLQCLRAIILPERSLAGNAL
ncbi:type II secretion system F family protein, partial [Enterobacter hormaechei]|uniref:type II secretion system F family protein n=1 Tax=Enterobacter hormaechei TaxID=158836 RepID=UPI00203BB5AB